MKLKRLHLVKIAFFGLMLIAFPVAAYHLISGRYAQALMAAGAAVVGLALATGWQRSPGTSGGAQTVRVPAMAPPLAPRQVAEEVPELLLPRAPREGWLRNGLPAGLVATGAMSVALVAAYILVVGLGDRSGGIVAYWFWALAHNQITQAVGAAPLSTVALQLGLGLAFSVVYAGFAEPMLRGRGWLRGLEFSLALWLLSIVLFLPVVGGGLLGLSLGAGPLPVLGNLIVHLVYGVVLGAVYAIPEHAGLDRSQEDMAAAVRADRGAAVGIVVGALGGAGIGALIQAFAATNPMIPPGSLVLVGGFIGGSWGALLGSLAGIGVEVAPGGSQPPGGGTERPKIGANDVRL